MPESVEFHAKKLMSPKRVVNRIKHINALRTAATPEAIDALIVGLGHSNPGVVKRCVYALAELGDERSIKPLIKLLGHDNDDVVQQAAWALGNMCNKSALPHLMKITGNHSETVNDTVKLAIRQIQGANRGRER